MKNSLKKELVDQIEAILLKAKTSGFGERYNANTSPAQSRVSELNQLLLSAIHRLSGARKVFTDSANECLKKYTIENAYVTPQLYGILSAIKLEIEAGYIQSLSEIIHADLFNDFLEMAEHLLQSGYKDPAAVLIGGVLEEHLRKLCLKSGVAIQDAKGDGIKADKMNVDLYKAAIYTSLEQKNILAQLDLRNRAAHGKYSTYSKENVEAMLSTVRLFISQFAA